MSPLIDTLRSGGWVTRERMRAVTVCLLAAGFLGALFLIATSDGLNDRFRRPLGTDFSNVYAAGTYVLEGRAAAPFDPAAQYAREQTIFGTSTPFYGWHYPPFFLAIAALLALMPYGVSLAVWQGATFILYVLSIRGILGQANNGESRGERLQEQNESEAVPDCHPLYRPNAIKTDWLLPTLAFPAVFINLGHGHNGFLTAALMGTALVQLTPRPLLAGVLFGCLAYKPQFGLLIPLALAAAGYWRAFFAAAATVVLFAIAVTWAFGSDVWCAFLASMHFTRTVVLEQGDTGWQKIQSAFSLVRMWGGSVPLAYAIQSALTLAAAGALALLWRSRAPYRLKAAALTIGTILATPYSLDYDLMLLAPGIAFLWVEGMERGFGPYERTALALLWIVPLIARSAAQLALLPLAVPLMLFTFVLLLRRAIIAERSHFYIRPFASRSVQ